MQKEITYRLKKPSTDMYLVFIVAILVDELYLNTE